MQSLNDMNGTGDCVRDDYVTQVVAHPDDVAPEAWNALLATQAGGGACGPFMRHEYLAALHHSESAVPETGWKPCWVLLWQRERLCAAAPLYAKTHSYGEYVFDWAWANAYAEHGLAYYPKGLVAVPFTPVSGPRLLAVDTQARDALIQAMRNLAKAQNWSSLHVLFAPLTDMEAARNSEWMRRQTVQFHWRNRHPGQDERPFQDFDDFLASLSQDKRKKIRQERRKVADAGIVFKAKRGKDISVSDWAFFYACYARTYWEHGNPPYLQPGFFEAMARDLPDYWVLFTACTATGEAVACSLVALSDTTAHPTAAYGRYWGALQRVDCLHFEACYYQPLEWCIEHGVSRFEGGAQGEHKMARALLPTATESAHWLAHPAFADAVDRFLQREGEGVQRYIEHLENRNPFRAGP